MASFPSRAITAEPIDVYEMARKRTAEVSYNELYERRGIPWELCTHGQGRCTIGRGVPRYYASEQHARSVAKCWIETGVSPADQLSVPPVTVEVSQGNPSLVARLLDPRPISPSEWVEIEGGVK